MKHFFALDLGSKRLVACHAPIHQPADIVDVNAFYLHMRICGEENHESYKQERPLFPCVAGGLKTFLGIEDYVKIGKGAFKADAIIVPLFRSVATALEKECLDGSPIAGDSSVNESVTVVGYPFGWNELQKKAYIQSVEEAGFPNVTLVDESSALIAYFKHFHGGGSSEQKGVLVYDLGSSSLNVAIAEVVSDGEMKRLATTGNPSLGECAFDERLDSLVREKLTASLKKSGLQKAFPTEGETHSFAVKLKERLSVAVANGTSEVTETFQLEELDLPISLSRSEVETLSEELVPELVEPVWEALSKAFLQPEEIGTVFFVGSAALLWCVQEGIGSLFPNAKTVWSENPQETMVKGLALHAIAKDRANQHLVMDTERQIKGAVSQEESEESHEKLRPVRSSFRKRILVGVASLVVLFVAMGWFFSEHIDIANFFYRSKAEVQEQKVDVSSGESTVQDEKRASNGALEIPEDLSKEVLLPQIDTPGVLQILCVLNESADDSDFYQGVLFATERLSVASVKELWRNDSDVLRRDESFAYRVVLGSKENLDILSNEEHDGVFFFPLSEGASGKNVPEIGVRDVMKAKNAQFVLFRGREIKHSEKDGVFLSPAENEGSLSTLHENLPKQNTLEDDSKNKKQTLNFSQEVWAKINELLFVNKFATTNIQDPKEYIYPVYRDRLLALVFFDYTPQEAEKMQDNSNVQTLVPPFEWHRGFWSVVLLLRQEWLEGEKTVENLSSFINSTRTIVTRNAVVLYKRHEDTQELQEMQRFPIIGWR